MHSHEILYDRPVSMAAFLKDVQRTVHEVIPDADVILYGSRARGDARPISDWDFLILVDQPVSWSLVKALRNRLYDLELETDHIISSIIRTHQEWNSSEYAAMPLKKAVEREGVRL